MFSAQYSPGGQGLVLVLPINGKQSKARTSKSLCFGNCAVACFSNFLSLTVSVSVLPVFRCLCLPFLIAYLFLSLCLCCLFLSFLVVSFSHCVCVCVACFPLPAAFLRLLPASRALLLFLLPHFDCSDPSTLLSSWTFYNQAILK